MESRMKGNFHVRFGERDVETRSLQDGQVRYVPTLHLMTMIAPDEREQFVRRLTESVIEDFFDASGLDTGVEMSYVLVRREAA